MSKRLKKTVLRFKSAAIILGFSTTLLLLFASAFNIQVPTNLNSTASLSFLYEKIIDPSYKLTIGPRTKLLSQVGEYASQYSPWLVYQSGWGTKLLYYCKNSLVGDVATDRVWRAELSVSDSKILSNQVAISGALNTDEHLACSPGIVISKDGTWHMYYVTAPLEPNGAPSMELYMYHATSTNPGTSWKKLGKIGGQFPQPYPDYLETPSPFYIDGKFVMYIVGNANGALLKTTSTDGHNFTEPIKLNAPTSSNSGRVSFDGKYYYYVYSIASNTPDGTPNQIRLAVSTDGNNFTYNKTLFTSNGSGWDGLHAWTPMLDVSSDSSRLYYSGNLGPITAERWWGSNTTIGYRDITLTSNAIKPLYSYWSNYFLDTYLSSSSTERTDLLKSGWVDKGIQGNVYDIKETGTVPLYKFWSEYYKDHYFTTDENEKNDLINHGWRLDGIVAYVYSAAQSNTKPLYKLICGTTQSDHYYVFTTSSTERTTALSKSCIDAGIAAHLSK